MPTLSLSRPLAPRRGGRHARLLALALVALAGSGALVPSARSAAGPLTVTPITWNVVGLDSNNVNSGPNVFPVGVRVCNTGADAASGVGASWLWIAGSGPASTFDGPTDGTSIGVGSLAGNTCRDVYFDVTVRRSPSSWNSARSYRITASATGGLSASAERQLYVEKLVSQNRNSTKKLAGPGGCNLTYTVCDPPAANLVVGQTYTYRLYGETATAYQQLEAFANFPSAIVEAMSASSTYGVPSGATSTSIYADACGWNTVTRACVGPATITGGKAGGRVVVTYLVRAVAPGSATLRATIYDFSGSSYHYNTDFNSITLTSSPLNVRYGLTATVTGEGTVTSSPAGTLTSGATSGLNCGTTGTTCSVGHASGTSVTLTATPGAGQTFVGWSGGCSGTSAACTVTMDASRTVTAAFTGLTSYRLDATRLGSGAVAADSGALDCGSTCAANYPSGTLVTLAATPSTGWSFSGWSGAGCSGTDPCTVAMSEARSVTATFQEITHDLDVTVSGSGSVTSDIGTINCGSGEINCRESYGAGTVVKLTAAPGSGMTLSGWSGGGCSGTASTCSVTMSEARSVTAAFVVGVDPDLTVAKTHVGSFRQGQTGATYSIVVTNGGSAATSGTVTVTDALPAALTATALSGTGWTCSLATTTCTRSSVLAAGASYPTITLTVDVAAGAPAAVTNVVHVAGGGEVNATNNASEDLTDVDQVADLTLTKTHAGDFRAGQTGATYTIAVANTGPGSTTGTVTVTDTLPAGLTATALAGTGWSCVVATRTCTRSDVLAAGEAYPPITLTVDVAAGAGGSVTNTAHVSGGGQVNTANDTATDPTTIRPRYALTLSRAGAGSGAVSSSPGGIDCGTSCSATYDEGAVVTLTAVAGAGSRFGGWSGAGCSGTAACVVTMSEARSVTATFVRVFELEVALAGSGSVSSLPGGIDCGVSCAEVYDEGTEVTLAAVAEPGSRFGGWSGAGCSGTDACVVTMSEARSVTATFVRVFELEVALAGAGSGSVVSAPGGLVCAPDCAEVYDEGTWVTLTAAAGAGSTFAGWSGAGCSGTSSCTVAMTAARSVTATFAPVLPPLLLPPPPSAPEAEVEAAPSQPAATPPATARRTALTVRIHGGGVVSSRRAGIACGGACRHVYREGTVVVLAAAPRPGWRFAGWAGACSGRGTTCRVSMAQARAVTARFAGVATLDLSLPARLVLHLPYEQASVRALVTWQGRRYGGARVAIARTCAGRAATSTLRTDSRGRATLRFGTAMPNHDRVVRCVLAARVSVHGSTATAVGTVGFVHPLWLETRRTASGAIGIRVWGRAGRTVMLHVDGSRVARATIGREGWVDVVTRSARPGSRIFVTSPDGHSSHVVFA